MELTKSYFNHITIKKDTVKFILFPTAKTNDTELFKLINSNNEFKAVYGYIDKTLYYFELKKHNTEYGSDNDKEEKLRAIIDNKSAIIMDCETIINILFYRNNKFDKVSHILTYPNIYVDYDDLVSFNINKYFSMFDKFYDTIGIPIQENELFIETCVGSNHALISYLIRTGKIPVEYKFSSGKSIMDIHFDKIIEKMKKIHLGMIYRFTSILGIFKKDSLKFRNKYIYPLSFLSTNNQRIKIEEFYSTVKLDLKEWITLNPGKIIIMCDNLIFEIMRQAYKTFGDDEYQYFMKEISTNEIIPEYIDFIIYKKKNIDNFRFNFIKELIQSRPTAGNLNEYLSHYKIDFQQPEKNEIILSRSLAKSNVYLYKILIDNGANINYAGKNGETALIKSIIAGNIKQTKFLIENGADLTPAITTFKEDRQLSIEIKVFLKTFYKEFSFIDYERRRYFKTQFDDDYYNSLI